MAYEKTNWIDKTPTNSGTPVNADNMNKIEQGIEDVTLQTEQHITDTDIHVTPEDKIEWDKISEVYKGEIHISDLDYTKDEGMYKVHEQEDDNSWLWVVNEEFEEFNVTSIGFCRQLFYFVGSSTLMQRHWTNTNGWSAWESYAYTSDLLPILQDIVELQEEKLSKTEAPNLFANAIIGTASGETITLSDVQKNTEARSLKILGETAEEVSISNRLPADGLNFVYGWNYSGDITRTQNVSMPEWGTNKATRIVLTGAPYQIKSITRNIEAIPIPLGAEIKASVYVHNQGSTPISIDFGNGTEAVVVQPNEKKLAEIYTNSVTSDTRFRITTSPYREDMDIVVWQPKVWILGKAPDNPYELQGVENPVVVVTDGTNTDEYPITTPPLYSLPDGTRDYIEIDNVAKTAKIHQHIERLIVDGSGPWDYRTDIGNADGFCRFALYHVVDRVPMNNEKMATNRFLPITTYTVLQNGFRNASAHIEFQIASSLIGVVEGDTKPQIIDKFRNWLDLNTLEIHCQLANPVITDLDYEAVKTYSPTSVISTDQGSLEVEYNRDINTALTESGLDPAMFVPRVNQANRVYTTSATGQQETKPLSDFATASYVDGKIDVVQSNVDVLQSDLDTKLDSVGNIFYIDDYRLFGGAYINLIDGEYIYNPNKPGDYYMYCNGNSVFIKEPFSNNVVDYGTGKSYVLSVYNGEVSLKEVI